MDAKSALRLLPVAGILASTLYGCGKLDLSQPQDSQATYKTMADVSGVVVDSQTGAPVFGAQVWLANTSTVTGESGLFSVSGVTAGTQRLTVTRDGYRALSRAVELVAGSNDAGEIRIVAQNCTPQCTGRVCGDDGCLGECGVCAEGEVCDAQGQCGLPGPDADTCHDGAKNGDESDVDCGGSCNARCVAEQRCIKASDCKSGSCRVGVCDPSCADSNGGCDPAATCTNSLTARLCACPVGFDGDGFTCTQAPRVWAGIGPAGGAGNDEVLIHFNGTTTTLYMASGYAGLFRSEDWGRTWAPVDVGASRVFTVAAHRTAPETIFVGTAQGVFKSTDSGQTWQPTPFTTGTYYLLVDPSTPSTIFALTSGHMFKSIDSGSIWTEINWNMVTITIARSNPAILYGYDGGDLFTSTNAGDSWTTINIPPEVVGEVRNLAIDPNNPATVVLASRLGGVWKSTNSGTDWTKLTNGLPSGRFGFVQYNSAGDYLYVASYANDAAAVYSSTNGGDSWTALPTPVGAQPFLLYTHPTTVAAAVLATTLTGDLLISRDYGGTWTTPLLPLVKTTIPGEGLTLDSKNHNVIYAAAGYGGAFRSPDGGASWSRIDNGLSLLDVRALAVDPVDSRILYAGVFGDPGVYRSEDSGQHWTAVSGSPSQVCDFVSSPANPTVLYATSWGKGIFKSIDQGLTWAPINNGITNGYVYNLDIDSSGTLMYAGTSAGLYKSTTGGTVWTAVTGLPSDFIGAIAIHPMEPKTALVGTALSDTEGTIYRTLDGGKTWGVVANTVASGGFAFDPVRPSVVYAGIGGFMQMSTDTGMSWQLFNQGLPKAVVGPVCVDPVDPTTVYAGTWGRGVYKTVRAN